MSLKTVFTRTVGKTRQSTVKVDSALAELLNDTGYRKDKDLHAIWTACHVLANLGLVKINQGRVQEKNGIEKLYTFFDADEKLRELMHECGQLDESDVETN